MCMAQRDHEPLSVLTSLPRDEWAAQRSLLLADPTNAASLRLVESALFCVTFESGAPATKEECAQTILCGTGRNKWFDKSFTVVVFENGRGGLNAEHTPVDAMTVVSMFVAVSATTRSSISDISEMAGRAEASSRVAVPAPPPRKLAWTVSAPLRRALETASVGIATLGGDVHLRLLNFAHYGKLFIKATKLHPDFFMQMAIQLAHYRIHRAFAPTYETGHTRAFYHGRTDTVRTCSLASCAFVRTMEDAAATAADKWSALKAACDSHGAQSTSK